MPVWAMIITDVVLTAAAIGVFMLFDYVMPQSSGVKGEGSQQLTVPQKVASPCQMRLTTRRQKAQHRTIASLQLPQQLRRQKRLQPHCVLSRRTTETGAIRTLPTIVQTKTL